jgi:RNA polymerase sigma factor (sigma-70 family)
MTTAALPPFERLYLAHRDELYRYARRLAGAQEADDVFQETFLRALRSYPTLRSSANLRSWLYTIATRIVIDQRRRPSALPMELPEIAVNDVRPAYAALEHLAASLPPVERAAVVLRYGYDLDYAGVATLLGSNEVAARQAASAGIRRLRRSVTT